MGCAEGHGHGHAGRGARRRLDRLATAPAQGLIRPAPGHGAPGKKRNVHADCSSIRLSLCNEDTAMTDRREFLAAALTVAGAAVLRPLPALAEPGPGTMLKRAIPSSGELIAVIGAATSGSFEEDMAGREPLREVPRFFVHGGATVNPASPNYSHAED